MSLKIAFVLCLFVLAGTRAQEEEEELPRCSKDGRCAEGFVCAAINCFVAPCPNEGLRCIPKIEPVTADPTEETVPQEEELPRCSIDGKCAEGFVCAAIDCFVAPCPNEGLRCIPEIEPVTAEPTEEELPRCSIDGKCAEGFVCAAINCVMAPCPNEGMRCIPEIEPVTAEPTEEELPRCSIDGKCAEGFVCAAIACFVAPCPNEGLRCIPKIEPVTDEPTEETVPQEEELPRCSTDGKCAEGFVCAAINCFMPPCPNEGLRCIPEIVPVTDEPTEPQEELLPSCSTDGKCAEGFVCAAFNCVMAPCPNEGMRCIPEE